MKSILLIIVISFCFNSFAKNSNKAIYGDDNRHEALLYPDAQFKDIARSVAAMVDSDYLQYDEVSNIYDFTKETLKEAIKTCPGETYENQYSLASCSGFLYKKDILITAGHCVENINDCLKYRWVFDFYEGTTSFNGQNVYKCKKIIQRKEKDTRFTLKDYAVIKLDREVKTRTPLKIRTSGSIKNKTPVIVIGHPMGLPMKIGDNGVKQKWSRDEKETFFSSLIKKYYYFRVNLDTFQANSGSPIINKKTAKVEGILINGAFDYETSYEYDEPCKKEIFYQDSNSQAEEVVLKIQRIPYVNKI